MTMTVRRAALHASTYAALGLTGLGLFTAYPGVVSFVLHLFLGFPLVMLVVGLAHWEGRRWERKRIFETPTASDIRAMSAAIESGAARWDKSRENV